MSDIPEDIHQAAEAAFEEVLSKAYKEYGFSSQYRLVGQTAREIIAAAILAERERHGWQPIETAPKDWTDIILYVPDDDDGSGAEGVCQGWFSMEDGGFNCWMTSNGPVEPTYWHPLPSPPKP